MDYYSALLGGVVLLGLALLCQRFCECAKCLIMTAFKDLYYCYL